jgi:hypothetical protein
VKPSTRFFTLLLLVFFNPLASGFLKAQVKFSFATDISVLHNFDDVQSFTVLGQTIQGLLSIDKKNTFYTWIAYHSHGKYDYNLTASANSAATQPQSYTFTSKSEMRVRQISIGMRRYLLGSYDRLEKFNLYGAAGFGLIMGRAFNNFSTAVDTSLYTVQENVKNGAGDFKRLSFDLTAGWEMPLGYEVFLYSEARLHIPTTEYPSDYLVKNNNAPFVGSINLGIRVLFNYDR